MRDSHLYIIIAFLLLVLLSMMPRTEGFDLSSAALLNQMIKEHKQAINTHH